MPGETTSCHATSPRAGQRACAAQRATGTKGKYTELLRVNLGPRGARREPVHAEPARRLAALRRAAAGATGATAQAPPSAQPFRCAPETFVVLVGIPGCGTSRCAALYPASWRVSLDADRLAATDDMTDQCAIPVAAQIRHAARARVVPASVLRDIHPQLPTAGPLCSEGFDAEHRADDFAIAGGRTR
ncbi:MULTISPECIES: hypothetical protein [Streptomyces]|uniref:ATP-binding protein n=1 Tax=Streptomyces luteosporeus TaxID=173856 RepID=A0ABP6GBI1_9ACTN